MDSNTIDFLVLHSSSDSDSDPEGGELPEVSYRKGRGSDDKTNGIDDERVRTKRVDDETGGVAPKKQSKKKRTEKAIEERVQKLARRREVNKFSSFIIERLDTLDSHR